MIVINYTIFPLNFRNLYEFFCRTLDKQSTISTDNSKGAPGNGSPQLKALLERQLSPTLNLRGEIHQVHPFYPVILPTTPQTEHLQLVPLQKSCQQSISMSSVSPVLERIDGDLQNLQHATDAIQPTLIEPTQMMPVDRNRPQILSMRLITLMISIHIL